MKLECNYVQLPKIYSYLTGNEFKVFTVIYDEWTMMKNENGWFYRSQKLLSEDSGLPLRTLQRTLKKLIEKGVILTTFYNDGVKMATYNKANEYKINLEVIYKLCKKDVKMTTKKGVKMTTEGCQNGAPSNNPISNNNNIYKHNNNLSILELKDLGPKVTEENKKEKNNKKEKVSDPSSMDVKVSEQDNKIFNKENEMKNGVLNGMNAISEQSERQAKENESSGCEKINEMKSSKSGDQNKIEDKVTSPKVSPSSNNNDPIDANVTGDKDMSSSFKNEDKVSGVSDQNANGPKNTDDNTAIPSKDDMAIDPNNSDVNANKASGDLENPSMEQLSNPIEKMEPDAPESPKTEFKRTSTATPNNMDDDGTIPQDTQVPNKESLSQPQVKNILPPATATLEEEEDDPIQNIIKNIDFSMKAMYQGRYDYGQFSSQYEYFTLQCHNLNVLMGDDKYQLYKKQYITPWWNNTKQYFPNGYEKLLKKPTQWEIDKFKKFYNWMEHAQEEREVATAYNNICALLEHLNSKYGEKTLDTLTNQIIHEISVIKHRNNHVSNYIEKIQAS